MVIKTLSVQARRRSHPANIVRVRRSVAFILVGAIIPICGFPLSSMAAPEGGNVVAGQGTIQQIDSATTLISQSSNALAIDWNQFNVGVDESVKFSQPSSSSVVLNRIVGQTPSEIFGRIDANGRVFLINPNGILFGKSATINVGSLLASSLNIDPDAFMRGDYTLTAAQDQVQGIVVNRGVIQASTGGSVTLVGGAVSNEGVILANLGHVNLAAGRKAVVDFDGDGLMRFEVDDEVVSNTQGLASAVNNSGEISAQGGEVLMKGAVAADVFSRVVNNDGIIKAGRVENKGGVIRLVGTGGAVADSGVIDASGQDASSSGGRVEILGDAVALNGKATINASGDAGGGTVLIGGDYQGNNPAIQNSTHTTVSADTAISADAKIHGDGGKVVVWSDDSTEFYGDISVRGGDAGGNGGFVEISGKQHLTVPLSQVTIDGLAPRGESGVLLLDPGTINICDFDLCGGNAGPDTFDDGGIVSTLATIDVILDATASGVGTTNGTAQDITVVDSTVDIT